ncbi:MAG: hypothetical protein K8E24_007700 [Methanobacterium paludis]|nr:hypothetical protein [Methanobacterium paludis]
MGGVAFKVAYIGTDFYGFQRQPNRRTVEEELLNAFKKANLMDDPKSSRYSIAGRTDRGVHAMGNVVSLVTNSKVIINQINDYLVDEIQIDPVGVKPLYYGKNDDKKPFAFASERKALWNIGIQDVKTLPPNQMLYNEELIDLGDRLVENKASKKGLAKNNSDENRSIDRSTENGLKLINKLKTGVITPENTFKNTPKDIVSKDNLKTQLKNFLIDSVEKRIKGLSKVGIIFSGGVDVVEG